MDLTSKLGIKNLLKKYNLRPSKGLGQNFLVDKTALKRVIASADLSPEDIVVEIGPGLGVLTLELAKKAGKVIAIEKDSKMIEALKETLTSFKNIEIIQEDVRKITNNQLPATNYKIVANLPFYLTAPVIRKFLEFGNPPELMTLIIQKEVAQRITAQPPKMNLLAVSVQLYAEPKIISYVSKKSFWPQPEVDAAIIKLKIRNLKSETNTKEFFRVVRAGFSQPRKMLINNLSKCLGVSKSRTEFWLNRNNIRLNQRAENLNITDWINLTGSFTSPISLPY